MKIKTSFERISLILPCFNEQENLDRFDQEVFEYFDSLGLEYECILVDDGSSDQTWAKAQELARHQTRLILARHEINKGLGAAIRTGIALASGDAVMTMDADLTFSPVEATKLISAYWPGVDCVMGSPFAFELKGVPFSRRVLSHAVNTMYGLLFAQPITAASSILRLYRSSRLKELKLDSTGFDINAEILFRLIKQGAIIKEVPVVLTARTQGYSKIKTFVEIKNHLRMFLRILKCRS